MIVVNREKAESTTLGRIRVERGKRLADLDVALMRAIEHGQETASIAAEKQALRDVTEKDFSVLSLGQLSSLTLDMALSL